MASEFTTDKVLRLDVWGGERSMDHIARAHYPAMDDAWISRAKQELAGGFLVNTRVLGPGEGWGPNLDFDERLSGGFLSSTTN